MQLAIPTDSIGRLAILFILVICGACSVSEPSRTQYHVDPEADPVAESPVTELQNQALAALEQEQYQLGLDYLQRAIKIQPRNAWSWHYLALSYWHVAQYSRCLDMIERSNSYGSFDDELTAANDELRWKCQ